MLGRVLELIVIIALCLFVFYEILVPAIQGKPLFPYLNKKRNTIKDEIREFNQRVADEQLKQTLEAAKRKEAAAQSRREAQQSKKEK